MIKKQIILASLIALLPLNVPVLSSPRAAAQIANLLENAGNEYKAANYFAAIDYYKKALEKDPSNPSIHFGLGASFIATENYSMAVEHLLRALELNPALTEVYFSLAYAYKALGKQNEAFAIYRQGLGFDLNNKLPRSKFWNEVVIGSSDDDTDGIQPSSLGIPERSATTSNLSIPQDVASNISILHDENYYKGQIADIKEELEKQPDDIPLKYKLALLYLKIKDLNKAKEIREEISGKNDELEEDLLERIEKLSKKQAAQPAQIEQVKKEEVTPSSTSTSENPIKKSKHKLKLFR